MSCRCFVERPHFQSCVTTEEANAFGGCGASGFYSQDGEDVYFQSTACEFSSTVPQSTTSEDTSESMSITTQIGDATSTTEPLSSQTTSTAIVQTTTHHVPDDTVSEQIDDNSHSSADRLSDGAIAGIIVGTGVGLVGVSLLATYYLKTKTSGNTGHEYQRL